MRRRGAMRVKIMNFHIPLVVASEKGSAQTNFYNWGCKVLTSGALFRSYASKVWIMITEGEHLGKLLKEALWKEAP